MTNEQIAKKMSTRKVEIRKDELREIYKETIRQINDNYNFLSARAGSLPNWEDPIATSEFLKKNKIDVKGTTGALKEYITNHDDSTIRAIVNFRKGKRKIKAILKINEATTYRNEKTYWGLMTVKFIVDSRGMFRGASNYFEGFTDEEIKTVTGTLVTKVNDPKKIAEVYEDLTHPRNINNYANKNTCFALGVRLYHSMISKVTEVERNV